MRRDATVETPSFDHADAALRALGERILADPNYADRAWRGIALVIEVGAPQQMFGFVYDADDWEAETPDDFDVFDDAQALADAMATGGERWRRCLLRFARKDGGAPRLKIDFDHDGTADWTVTPANLSEMVERLRPQED
jgi:hypothetical protein